MEKTWQRICKKNPNYHWQSSGNRIEINTEQKFVVAKITGEITFDSFDSTPAVLPVLSLSRCEGSKVHDGVAVHN